MNATDHHQFEGDRCELGVPVARALFDENRIMRDQAVQRRRRRKAIIKRWPVPAVVRPIVPPRGGSKASQRRRNRVRALLRRDGQRCHWCKRGFGPKLPPTLEHLVMRSAGGGSGLDNLVLACEPCNGERGGIHGAAPRYLSGLPSKPKVRV